MFRTEDRGKRDFSSWRLQQTQHQTWSITAIQLNHLTSHFNVFNNRYYVGRYRFWLLNQTACMLFGFSLISDWNLKVSKQVRMRIQVTNCSLNIPWLLQIVFNEWSHMGWGGCFEQDQITVTTNCVFWTRTGAKLGQPMWLGHLTWMTSQHSIPRTYHIESIVVVFQVIGHVTHDFPSFAIDDILPSPQVSRSGQDLVVYISSTILMISNRSYDLHQPPILG